MGERCPTCGQLVIGGMNRREVSQLRYLLTNPGMWGGPLDRGQGQGDPEIVDWTARGLIEARQVRGRWGYFLTDRGRQGLAQAGVRHGR